MNGYDYSATTNIDPTIMAGLWGVIAAFAGIAIIIGLVFYVFYALVLMSIAKKTDTPNPWLAWIPIGNLYLMTQIAQVPWWTFLVIFLGFIPVVNIFAGIATLAISIWWWWKICERLSKPGWWSLLIAFIPIVNLILLGILAWGGNGSASAQVPKAETPAS